MSNEIKSITEVLNRYDGEYFELSHHRISGNNLYYGTEANPYNLCGNFPESFDPEDGMLDMVGYFATGRGYSIPTWDTRVEEVINLFYHILEWHPFAYFCMMKREGVWTVKVTSHSKPCTPDFKAFCNVKSNDLTEALSVAYSMLIEELKPLMNALDA